jgi:mannose-6-phosphate isomerase-like protein (cupin superfamily)
MRFEERPWGSFTALHSKATYQVKKLVVDPGKRLSLQSHKFRAENWFIVSGAGLIQLENKNKEVAADAFVDILIGTKHRISCTSKGPLTFVEVQTGKSFNESDIIRFHHDFGKLY